MRSLSYQSFLFKLIFKFFIVIQLLCCGMRLQAQHNPQKKVFTVVIDAGHGGKDPGTIWKNIHEKDIALAIALKFGNIVKKNMPDTKVLYTRQTDIFIDLDKRAPVANKNQADLFISIHVNSNDKSIKADGTETYFMGTAKNDENFEVAKKENAVIQLEDNYTQKYAGYDPNSPNSFIMFSLLQNTHWKQSLRFASYVQEQMASYAKRPDRGVKQAGFLVLWRTAVPSVLIETGFLSNENDRNFLTSEHGQDVLAQAIYRAFRNYKADVENGSTALTERRAKDTLPEVPKTDTFAPSNTDTLVDSVITNQPTVENVPVKSKIEFLVQISSSRKAIPLKSHFFKGLKNVEEFKSGNNYKYAVGRKSSYNEVVEYSKIVKNYFPDAFVIAVRDGKIISVKEALKEIKD